MHEKVPVEFRPSALAYQSIVLQDGTTELERKMYLSHPDPDTCVFPNTLFGAYLMRPEFHIALHTRVQSIAECRQLCLLNPECVIFIYGTSKRCNLRKGMVSADKDARYALAFKLCGTIYYEGNSGKESLTVAKNLESASLATREGSFRAKKCLPGQQEECYVIIKYI